MKPSSSPLSLLRMQICLSSILFAKRITDSHNLGAYCEIRKPEIRRSLIHHPSKFMSTRSNPTFSPPPLLHTRSSPSVNQQFPSLRPPLQITPTRDGRSRSTNQVNGSNAPSKPESMTYDNFYDILNQRYCPLYSCSCRIDDPLYNDQLARLNRITTSLSQQLSTLESSAKRYADLDSQQKELLKTIQEAKDTLERESHGRLNTAIPEIAEQNKTMENIEKRVDAARSKLAEESDLVYP